MASIKTESAGNWSDFATTVVLGFFSLIAPIHLSMWLGVDHALDGYPAITLAVWAILTVVSYGILQGLLMAAFALLSRLTAFVEGIVGFVANTVEWALTAVVEVSAQFGLKLLLLPFIPFMFAAKWLYSVFIAGIAERRRQNEELRRLYEEVKDEYGSFEEFVRDFHSGGAQSGQKQKEREDAAAPPPRDAFKEACAAIGLPPDGSFSEAEFKERYHALIKAVHPDMVGPNAFAAQLNEARNVIRKRKGW